MIILIMLCSLASIYLVITSGRNEKVFKFRINVIDFVFEYNMQLIKACCKNLEELQKLKLINSENVLPISYGKMVWLYIWIWDFTKCINPEYKKQYEEWKKNN